jgi:hypothetical protein
MRMVNVEPFLPTIPVMKSNMPSDVFEPFETIFLARREGILRLVGLSSYALRSLDGLAKLSEALRHEPAQVAQAKEIEEAAAKEVQLDFPLLHSAATVLLWGALEAAFRDFIARWLGAYPVARQCPELKKVRVCIAEYESLQGDDRMRYVTGILEKELAASLRPGVGRFDCILKIFDIHPEIDEDTRRDLHELAAIRNVIVHRAGLADERFVALCPWLQFSVGQKVEVGAESFQRFVAAASNYAAALVTSAASAQKNVKDGPDAA